MKASQNFNKFSIKKSTVSTFDVQGNNFGRTSVISNFGRTSVISNMF
jgi:hypothetical protein